MSEFRIEPTFMFLRKYLPSVPSNIREKFYDLWKRQLNNSKKMAFPPNNCKPLNGYVKLNRLRINDYRLIYRIEENRIICINIGKRDEIYNSLKYDPDREMVVDVASDLPTYIEIDSNFHNRLTPFDHDNSISQNTPLPFMISSSKLESWGIKPEFHILLDRVNTEEKLLNLVDELPPEVLDNVFDRLFPPHTEHEKDERKKIQKEIEEFLQFKCPIDGCGFLFKKFRWGWDRHVELLSVHPEWHSEVEGKKERKLLFKKEFPEWFGFQVKKQSPTKKLYKCPIDECGTVFANSRGGWNAHVGTCRNHRNWHPEVEDTKERQKLFKKEFPSFFQE